jgi:hypothetical protein
MTDDEIRRAYQEVRSGDSAGPCIPEEQLVKAATGEADGSERERIADHLIACARCAEEFRLLTSLEPWTQESAALLNPEAAPRATVARMPSRWIEYAMAASLVLTFGGGIWIGAAWPRPEPPLGDSHAAIDGQLADARHQLEDLERRAGDQQREIAELRRAGEASSAPEPNVPIVELDAADAFRGDPTRARTFELASNAKLVTFVLNAAPGASSSSFDLDMVDSSGRVMWTSSGLRAGPNDSFTLAVPRVLLPTGEAHLRLYGHRGSRRALVEDFRVRFAYR